MQPNPSEQGKLQAPQENPPRERKTRMCRLRKKVCVKNKVAGSHEDAQLADRLWRVRHTLAVKESAGCAYEESTHVLGLRKGFQEAPKH